MALRHEPREQVTGQSSQSGLATLSNLSSQQPYQPAAYLILSRQNTQKKTPNQMTAETSNLKRHRSRLSRLNLGPLKWTMGSWDTHPPFHKARMAFVKMKVLKKVSSNQNKK